MNVVLSNLAIILLGIITNIDQCNAQQCSIKWSETAPDQTLQGHQEKDRFGWTLGISNRYSIIGAFGEDNITGAAYIYKQASNGTWNLAQRLEGGIQARGYFGWSVDISNEYAIIGAFGEDNLDGAAYIYKRASDETWKLAQKLQGTQSGGWYGVAVGISNGYAIVGAPVEDKVNGAVYIYERLSNGTWNLVQRFQGVGGRGVFGWKIDITNGYAIIGSWIEKNFTGAAYIYERVSNGTWKLAQKLEGTQAGEFFGVDVAISNGHAIIGASQNSEMQHKNGSAYIYERASNGTWYLAQRLVGVAGGQFGIAVEISNEYVIVGAFKNGIAYIYRHNMNGVWLFSQKLGVSGVISKSNGISVAISNNSICTGTESSKVLCYNGLSEC